MQMKAPVQNHSVAVVASNVKSARSRVQFALGLYLAVFILLNILVWTWFVIHRHGPHFFPLGERVERFGDLLRFTGKYQIGKDPRMRDDYRLIHTLFPKNYPPLAVLVYLFLLQVCAPYALPVLLVVMVGGMLFACVAVYRTIRNAPAYRWYVGCSVFATGLFGWGTEQVVIRGNIEGLLWVVTAFGAFLFGRRRYGQSGLAFGVACCLKPQAVLWLVLLGRHGKFKAVVLSIVTAALVTLGSLLVIDRNPVQAYRHISGRSTFFEDYIVSFRPIAEAKMDHSLLQSMKMVTRIVRYRGFNFPVYERDMLQADNPLARKLCWAYLPIAGFIGLMVLWKVWRKPVLNQIFALACITTVLPPISADYTLNIVLVPLGFFLIHLIEDVAEERAHLSTANMLWFLLPCAWLFGIEQLWILQGVLKCVAAFTLLAASISVPLPTRIFDEIDSESKVHSSHESDQNLLNCQPR